MDPIIEELVAKRTLAGRTQSDVARAAGLNRATLCETESGKHGATLATARKWAAALDLELTLKPASPPPGHPADVYLVWSHKQRAWWGPEGHGYRYDVWEAGRYSRAAAVHACGLRTWEPNTVPPEVAVLAPESGRRLLSVAEIRATTDVMAHRISATTDAALKTRAAPAAGGEAARVAPPKVVDLGEPEGGETP